MVESEGWVYRFVRMVDSVPGMSDTHRTEIPVTVQVADSMHGKQELASTYLARLRTIRSQIDALEGYLADAVESKATWGGCADLGMVIESLGDLFSSVMGCKERKQL